MIGHRTAVGLLLLCALFFSAIAVQSASAAKAVNTTAFTCVKGGPRDFSDAHCDTKVAAGTGKFGHEAIANDTTTEIEVDNSSTGEATDPAVLLGKAFGVATELTCNKLGGTGTLHNVLSESTKHTITGTITIKFTDCSVQKPAKCDVKEPIEFTMNAEGFEEGGNMGVEFKPAEGETFVSVTYTDKTGEECSLDGKTFNATGTVVATAAGPAANASHSGATPDFDHAKLTARKSLLIGGVPAGFEDTVTMRMKGGGPIALTTTT